VAIGVRTGERLGPREHGASGSGDQGREKRVKELERELARKDRALAETAALLVLRKKASAIWGGGEDA